MQIADKTKIVSLVNRYFTPFAVFLVLSAIIIGKPSDKIGFYSIFLLVIALIFNVITGIIIRKVSSKVKLFSNIRLFTNFAFNIVFVYLLGFIWAPVWLLFLLTPVATGLYSSLKKTFLTSIGVSGSLLLIYAIRGMRSEVGWGQAIVQAVFIISLSLFVNALSRLASKEENVQNILNE